MGGGLPDQVGLRPGMPRQALPPPPHVAAPGGISFQSAGTLDKPVHTTITVPGSYPGSCTMTLHETLLYTRLLRAYLLSSPKT